MKNKKEKLISSYLSTDLDVREPAFIDTQKMADNGIQEGQLAVEALEEAIKE